MEDDRAFLQKPPPYPPIQRHAQYASEDAEGERGARE
jgi:hypothetical protein